MDRFLELVSALQKSGCRFVVIGVWGANYYAPAGGMLFTTLDRDLFLPRDAANLLSTWKTCDSLGLRLSAGKEPPGAPLDRSLEGARGGAESAHERAGRARASGGSLPDHDRIRVRRVWEHRRVFRVGDVEIPVAKLSHIVASEAKANRPKDRLFLETHAEALKKLTGGD